MNRRVKQKMPYHGIRDHHTPHMYCWCGFLFPFLLMLGHSNWLQLNYRPHFICKRCFSFRFKPLTLLCHLRFHLFIENKMIFICSHIIHFVNRLTLDQGKDFFSFFLKKKNFTFVSATTWAQSQMNGSWKCFC